MAFLGEMKVYDYFMVLADKFWIDKRKNVKLIHTVILHKKYANPSQWTEEETISFTRKRNIASQRLIKPQNKTLKTSK
jgi:hypothetical protein